MSAFRFRATWQRLAGAIVLLLAVCRSILDFSGYVDFFATHTKEPGWVGVMFDWLLNPPSWAIMPTIALGPVSI